MISRSSTFFQYKGIVKILTFELIYSFDCHLVEEIELTTSQTKGKILKVSNVVFYSLLKNKQRTGPNRVTSAKSHSATNLILNLQFQLLAEK